MAAATKVRDMQRERVVRSFAKRGDATEVPDLWQVQQDAYDRFLQYEIEPDSRAGQFGLEGLCARFSRSSRTTRR